MLIICPIVLLSAIDLSLSQGDVARLMQGGKNRLKLIRTVKEFQKLEYNSCKYVSFKRIVLSRIVHGATLQEYSHEVLKLLRFPLLLNQNTLLC